MSYQSEREEFIVKVIQNGGNMRTARLFLRLATKAQRLAEAACNGDYPADNGERPTKLCTVCECGWASENLNLAGVCESCRTDQRLEQLCRDNGWKVNLSGDPRGCVVKILFPNGAYNTWGGPESGWGVPTRFR